MKLTKLGMGLFAIVMSWNLTASAWPCGEYIYNKNGKLRKYEYNNLTCSENTKKHGSSTSSAVSTEATTAASDPGVTTGASGSYTQFSSSYGDCSPGKVFAGMLAYNEYIEQNMYQIKDEMALGQGGHLEILAKAFQCDSAGAEKFSHTMQKNFKKFSSYEPSQYESFDHSLREVISSDLSTNCTTTIL